MARLTGLAISTKLAWLALLTLLARLARLSRLPRLLTLLPVAASGIAHAARQSFHLVAQLLDLIERFLRILLLAIEGLLCLVQLIAQALHAIGDAVVAE